MPQHGQPSARLPPDRVVVSHSNGCPLTHASVHGGEPFECRFSTSGKLCDATDDLRHVPQESHCSPVQHILYNAVDPRCCNLVASLGKNQVQIWLPSGAAVLLLSASRQ